MLQTKDHRSIALTNAEYGRELAAAIDDAVLAQLPDDAELLTVYAHRIRLCSQPSNIWTARDLHNSTGECFSGSGRFWHCGLKLCSYCVAKTSQRQRAILRRVIKEVPIRTGYNLQFLTLTIKNEGVPLLDARAVFNKAWALFRGRKWFQDHIRGGCKNEEFTLTAAGYHYHAHAIVESRYVDYGEMRDQWTSCVREAYRETQFTLTVETSDELLIANIQKINTIEGAIKECAKYITKSDSWSKIPQDDLLDFCRIRRYPRMFEMFGTFKQTRAAIADREAAADAAAIAAELAAYGIDPALNPITEEERHIIYTRELSERETSDIWRDRVTRDGAIKYIATLEDEIQATGEIRIAQLKRKYHAAVFRRVRPGTEHPYNLVLNRIELIASAKVRANLAPRRWRMQPHGLGIEWID